MTEKAIRCTYSEIKAEALLVYYDFCRDQRIEGRSSQENIMASIDYHFDGTFNYSLEKLMFLVVELVLSGGWNSKIEDYCRKSIDDWQVQNNLIVLLGEIPKEESELFLNDLLILELLESH